MTKYPPQSVALICGDRQLTYQELDQRSNQLAQYLNHIDIPNDAFIGIYMERSIEIVVAILAVLKAGRTYVPLDPHYPEERIDFIAQETQVAILLTQQDLRDRLSHLQDTPKLCIDSQWHKIAQSSCEPLNRDIDSDSLAYVMYTSGSTGKPKGVKMPRANIFRYITALAEIVPVQDNDIYLHVASFSFSSSIRQLLLPLSVGATLVLATREQTRNPLLLLQLMHRQHVTVFDGVPSVWRYALPLIQESDEQQALVSNLRLKYLILSGELTPAVLLTNLRQTLGDRVQFFNVYGQTETIGSSAYHVPESFNKERGYVPVGYPYPHNQAFILDEHLNPVPTGEVGELYLAGGCLAQGYMNRDDLTAEKFIKTPWPNGPDRIFNTGDLARKEPDGRLELLGRTDFQVKIRGMRVELDEISAVLEQHPEVKTAATAAHESASGEMMVVGYVVPYSSQTTGSQWHHTLRQCIGEHLPDYMVPALFMELDALPKTPSGKLDRRGLPKPDALSQQTELEIETNSPIQAIFCKAFQVGSVDPEDTFITLGGHSLLYVQFSIELERYLGFLPEEWEHLTVAELEQYQPEHNSTKSVEITLALRAIAICAVVINHAGVIPGHYIHGGATILLMIAGANFARFQHNNLVQRNYKPIIQPLFLNLIVPFFIFESVYQIHVQAFSPSAFFIIRNFFSSYGTGLLHSWFIEVYVQCIGVMLLLFSLNAIRNRLPENPWRFSMILLGLATAVGFISPLIWDSSHVLNLVPQIYLWVFLLGWTLHFSKNRHQKFWLTCLAIASALIVNATMIVQSQYVWFCICVPCLIWNRSMPVHKRLIAPIEIIGASSFYIYLSHMGFFLIAQEIGLDYPLILFLFGMSGGILVWFGSRRLQLWLTKFLSKIQAREATS